LFPAAQSEDGLLSEARAFAEKALGLPAGSAAAAPLEADASFRRYFRLTVPERFRSERRFLLMIADDLQENRIWKALGERFREGGFPLPEIHAHDPERGINVLEDLGDGRLDGLDCPEESLAGIYSSAAGMLARFHAEALRLLGPSFEVFLREPYDAGFAFEREFLYFLDGLGLLFPGEAFPQSLPGEGKAFAAFAASLFKGRAVIHRDFQSRNVILKNGVPHVIDWQGARLGPPQYDLASLLFDPYANLSVALTEKAAASYLAASPFFKDPERLWEETRILAAMRLMQAFGAFAHLSLAKGKPAYGAYLKPAAVRLRALSGIPSMSPFRGLRGLLASLPEKTDGLSPSLLKGGPL
jgi:aminoglycoside/choline kinase family phosphotransferase